MENILGEIIYESRLRADLTQDQYGAKYSISGPAVFKFEKGFVRPSLELWLQMAKDAEVPERRAVILWLKAKLPKQYQGYLEVVDGPAKSKRGNNSTGAKGQADFSAYEDREAMREAAIRDKSLPKALQELLNDDEVWSLTKPTGHEINLLREMFGPLGKGSASTYREALRLVREFTHSF